MEFFNRSLSIEILPKKVTSFELFNEVKTIPLYTVIEIVSVLN